MYYSRPDAEELLSKVEGRLQLKFIDALSTIPTAMFVCISLIAYPA